MTVVNNSLNKNLLTLRTENYSWKFEKTSKFARLDCWGPRVELGGNSNPINLALGTVNLGPRNYVWVQKPNIRIPNPWSATRNGLWLRGVTPSQRELVRVGSYDLGIAEFQVPHIARCSLYFCLLQLRIPPYDTLLPLRTTLSRAIVLNLSAFPISHVPTWPTLFVWYSIN